MKCCKVCLTENYYPQPLEDSNLIEFSKTFFKTFGAIEDIDERHLFCVKCINLIWKSYTLLLKAVSAQQAQDKQIVKHESLQNIRNQYGLLSSLLSYHKVEVDYFLTGEDNTDEEEVDLKIFDTKDVIIKQEYSEYFMDTVDNEDEHYSSTQKETRKRGRKRKGSRKAVTPVVKRARKPHKKKDVVVETGPRPVDVTVDHIIEGKRRPKKLLKQELLQNDSDSDTYDIPLQERKKKKKDSEPEYDPNSDSDTNSSSSEYYSTATGKRLQHPVRKYPRECELCSSEVESARAHYLHYVNYHKETEYPYKLDKKDVCHQCGKSFSNRYNLTDHLLTHNTEKTIACEMCNKSFLTMKRKLSHIRLVHVPKKFFCDYCEKGFTTKSCLILHIRTHTGCKPYSCHICGVKYAHGGNLLVHIRNIHQNDGRKKQNKVKDNDDQINKTAKKNTDGKKTKKSGKKANSSENKKKRNNKC